MWDPSLLLQIHGIPISFDINLWALRQGTIKEKGKHRQVKKFTHFYNILNLVIPPIISLPISIRLFESL